MKNARFTTQQLTLCIVMLAFFIDMAPAFASPLSHCGEWLLNSLPAFAQRWEWVQRRTVPVETDDTHHGLLTIRNSVYVLQESTPGVRMAIGDGYGKYHGSVEGVERTVLEILAPSGKRLLKYVCQAPYAPDFECSDEDCSFIAIKDYNRLVVFQKTNNGYLPLFSEGERYHSIAEGLNGVRNLTEFRWTSDGRHLNYTINEKDYTFSLDRVL